MPAIAVEESNVAIERARALAEVAESFLLDTPFHGLKIGATGRTHDWSISRQIVDTVSVPVILAGGLGADNVRDAIQAVRPWGVYSFTRTSRPDDLRRKDLAQVAEFIAAAKAA